MCGIRSRIFLLSLAGLLLLQCSFAWADVVLTDAEVTVLKQSLQTAKNELTEQQRQIEKLENSLNSAKEELNESEKNLTEAQKQLQISENETEMLKQDLTKLSKSWKEQKKEARWGKVKAFCMGIAIGGAAGLAGGYYLTR